jgi:uncharacterized protein (DUF433 family)
MGSEKYPRHHSSGFMASVPVIRGTRVSLGELVVYLKDGRGLEGFLADYPQVTPAQANQAIVAGLEALAEIRHGVLELGGEEADEVSSPLHRKEHPKKG